MSSNEIKQAFRKCLSSDLPVVLGIGSLEVVLTHRPHRYGEVLRAEYGNGLSSEVLVCGSGCDGLLWMPREKSFEILRNTLNRVAIRKETQTKE